MSSKEGKEQVKAAKLGRGFSSFKEGKRISDTEMAYHLRMLATSEVGNLAMQYLNQQYDRDNMRKFEQFCIAKAYVDGFGDAEYHQNRKLINKLTELVQRRYNRNEDYWNNLRPDQKDNPSEAEYRGVKAELKNLLLEFKQL